MIFQSHGARLGIKKLPVARADQMNSGRPAAPAAAVAEPLRHTTSQHNSDNHHKQHKGRQHRPRPAVLAVLAALTVLVVGSFGSDLAGDNKAAVAAGVVSIGHCRNHHGVFPQVDSSGPIVFVSLSLFKMRFSYATYHILYLLLDRIFRLLNCISGTKEPNLAIRVPATGRLMYIDFASCDSLHFLDRFASYG